MTIAVLVLPGDEIRRVVMETLIPFVKIQAFSRVKGRKHGSVPDVLLAEYEQFDDYLEMVVQFGVRAHLQLVVTTPPGLAEHCTDCFSTVYHFVCICIPTRRGGHSPLHLHRGTL